MTANPNTTGEGIFVCFQCNETSFETNNELNKHYPALFYLQQMQSSGAWSRRHIDTNPTINIA